MNLSHISPAERHSSTEHLHPRAGLDEESTSTSPLSPTALPFKCIPLPFFHSSRFKVFRWFSGFCLEKEQLASYSLGYSVQREGCCNYPSVQHEKHFLGWQCQWYPTRTWPRLRRAIATLFSVTESVPSLFHCTEQQTLLMLALLL